MIPSGIYSSIYPKPPSDQTFNGPIFLCLMDQITGKIMTLSSANCTLWVLLCIFIGQYFIGLQSAVGLLTKNKGIFTVAFGLAYSRTKKNNLHHCCTTSTSQNSTFNTSDASHSSSTKALQSK